MITTCVYVYVKPEFIEQFIEACAKNHKASVQEVGNLRFDVLQSEANPAEFMLYEAYQKAEFAAAHKETEHYKTWRDTVADMMEKPRIGVKYKMLYPLKD